MAYANNDGVKIYYEVVGKGPPLLLHHPFACDHTSWSRPDENWVEALQDDFTLIIMDARGHGFSDKPHSPEDYQLVKMASDVVAVLDDLQSEKAHFLGYSMGGVTGFGLACHFPERFNSFVLGGANPEDDIGEPNPFIPFLKQGPEAFIGMIERMSGRPISPWWKKILLVADYEAWTALQEEASIEVCGMEAMLPSVKVPTLIYAGDEDFGYDGAKRASELMPNATFLSLHGDHLTPYLSEVMPHTKKLVQDVG
jgi:pimeloyl-ACP methyl ester carboxylesterase